MADWPCIGPAAACAGAPVLQDLCRTNHALGRQRVVQGLPCYRTCVGLATHWARSGLCLSSRATGLLSDWPLIGLAEACARALVLQDLYRTSHALGRQRLVQGLPCNRTFVGLATNTTSTVCAGVPVLQDLCRTSHKYDQHGLCRGYRATGPLPDNHTFDRHGLCRGSRATGPLSDWLPIGLGATCAGAEKY